MKFVSPEPVTKYLLGTYELELAPLIEELCGKHFDVVINIGAEFGYYAAGLALRMPGAKIIAFEAQQQLHYHIRRTAKDNGVDGRVSVRGSCDADLLNSAIPDDKKCLVVMDCEGGEFGLLDPLKVPKLRGCHVLVELHEYMFPGSPDVITDRFRPTHKIIEIPGRPRTAADFPLKLHWCFMLPVLKKYYILNTMNEWRRKQMKWLYLEPRKL